MRNFTNWKILGSSVVLAVLLAGCSGESPTVGDTLRVTSSNVITAPQCIEPATGKAEGETYGAQECLAWNYHNGRLSLLHANAVYNCCLDSVTVSMTVDGQTITVFENEHLQGNGCRCLCRYNLDYQAEVATEGRYAVKLFSDNAYYGHELLFEFSIDLASSPSGSYCLEP